MSSPIAHLAAGLGAGGLLAAGGPCLAGRRWPWLVLMPVVGLLPDLDVLLPMAHRGASHSLLLIVALALLVVCCSRLLTGDWRLSRWLGSAIGVVLLLHVGMDIFSTWVPVQLFWPLDVAVSGPVLILPIPYNPTTDWTVFAPDWSQRWQRQFWLWLAELSIVVPVIVIGFYLIGYRSRRMAAGSAGALVILVLGLGASIYEHMLLDDRFGRPYGDLVGHYSHPLRLYYPGWSQEYRLWDQVYGPLSDCSADPVAMRLLADRLAEQLRSDRWSACYRESVRLVCFDLYWRCGAVDEARRQAHVGVAMTRGRHRAIWQRVLGLVSAGDRQPSGKAGASYAMYALPEAPISRSGSDYGWLVMAMEK